MKPLIFTILFCIARSCVDLWTSAQRTLPSSESLTSSFCLQSSTGNFSQKLWLGVAATSVSLYKQGESEALESLPYGQICSYGVFDSNTFKITAGDRDLLFETTKVQSSGPKSLVAKQFCSLRERRKLSAL